VKHATAKIYFEGLPKFAIKLDERVNAECAKGRNAKVLKIPKTIVPIPDAEED
jgi:hypothetical protein